MTGSAFSDGWWSGWIRCSWSAFTSSAAVSAIASSPRSRPGAGRAGPAVVAVRDVDGALLRPSVPERPRGGAPPARERDGRRATLEIVTLLAVEHREKFGPVQTIHLARDAPVAGDEAGIPAEVEEPAAHAALADERRAPREHRMQRIPPHQRSVRKHQRPGGAGARAGPRRPVASGG